MKKRDKFYILIALLCWLWFAVISASGCEFLDAPFAFVSGCHNYGVNWNAVLAPTGLLVLFAGPVCALYFLYRLLQIMLWLLKLSFNKLRSS
ncbi:MAG: hypothetical protein OCD00_11960 [Colwellia sp.]